MTILLHDLRPTPDDGLPTETSEEQESVEQSILELIQEVKARPEDAASLTLDRLAHVTYLTQHLKPLPAKFTALDSSRPWMLYWNLHAFGLLDCELSPPDARRAVSTLLHCRPTVVSEGVPLQSKLIPVQPPRSGFGGGAGQRPHLATTYAAVMALAYVGDERAWASGVDRRAMHDWLMELKQRNGSFVMHHGGEIDVRGCYCALTVAAMLNILTPDLMKGTAEFVASCQTFEGGLASASHSYPGLRARPPLGEAHGGYAFCALASFFILLPHLDSTSWARHLDLDVLALTRWFATMQAMPIEGGGFRGRTNKLVDGCYSWWCGGLGTLLNGLAVLNETEVEAQSNGESDGKSDEWEDEADDALFDRDGLQEYILINAQAPKGGLRDKPGRSADGYHTCYNLSGLSSAQHRIVHSTAKAKQLREAVLDTKFRWNEGAHLELIKGADETDEAARLRIARVYAHALAWTEDSSSKRIVGVAENEVLPTHPVFNVTLDRAERMMNFFYGQPATIRSAVT